MYRPPAFREDRPQILHEAIRAHPLGTLITAGASGLMANVIPFSLHVEKDGDVLRAHLAKANEQIAGLRKGTPVLVVFQGLQGYVSPSWYPTKREHGKVVPTWNYVIVQAHGPCRVIDDPAWLLEQITELTSAQENGRAEPWDVSDAPDDYVKAQLKGIVGLEIPISRLEGKWKMSQNQPERNQRGVAAGLREDGHAALANEVIARSKDS
ncbi:FMN-binding negative transcriptional regulator [Tsuneonella sp. CC-YZS046]|uniref:FMN-binding negative transcriptional regulator n=1 Tax=Tsuneonella sp. CC-YZS046 TaxID=3042152 RepID=UPI002D7743D0|nr:FMN-binding negative transcriptional regulator [Tsuneonella sp. CC-YZS046]WRO67020.1 FMN-binding negative transcriptional regulator [Tsuneonella sp. CC-YZS046]